MKRITIINCEKKISHKEIDSLIEYWFKQFKVFKIRLLHVSKWENKLPEIIEKAGNVYFMDQDCTPVSKRFFLSTLRTFLQTRTNDDVTFIIGPSEGFTNDFKRKYFSNTNKISLSHLTFTHSICTLILAEQLYRAEQTIANKPYDK